MLSFIYLKLCQREPNIFSELIAHAIRHLCNRSLKCVPSSLVVLFAEFLTPRKGRCVEFIFMLTHHDITIPNALEVFEEVKDSGLKCIGCKDIGLSLEQYRDLFRRIRKSGLQSFLEVVTYSETEHFKGVDLAITLEADNLIGGMPEYTEKTAQYLKTRKAKTRFYPYIGTVTGHPCILSGETDKIIEQGKRSESLGIDGINLLLYRYTGNQEHLLKSVKRLTVPVIVAGNVVDFRQIHELNQNRIWGFTIGGAIMEKKFLQNESIRAQVEAVLHHI